MANPIVSFYSGQKPDSLGRSISEIHNWDDHKLEYIHNYIQWLFPLREISQFNPDAPLLKDEDIAAFLNDKSLRDNLLASFDLMLRFYGFSRTGLTISCADDWDIKSRNWLSPGNHNFLRITRILTSLSLLGLKDYASAFLSALKNLYNSKYQNTIGPITWNFWLNAVK